MTSRPVPGAQDSAFAPSRRATGQYGQELVVETDGRPPKASPIQHDGVQSTASESARIPPKGKPQLFFRIAPDSVDSIDTGPTATALLPVPPRPSLSVPAESLQQRRLVPGGSGVKSDPALTKLAQYDHSASAAMLSGGKAADLFPWTGSHPEDVLSEALVKGGISNKSQIMNETNTARPSLWANLKNKSGTSTLSTLFIAVLEKRQSCSRLAAPNTFKPPPRLTLRDSTRESWLHDLANPAVGLRRLSRTIPHGITGKVLLEQCLNKGIPIPRALWLAKCVGINEMRAHKRKGQAGTITWVRGWTSAVEQFLDGVIAGIGQQDWKSRITYALQLAAHLFKEHLVEEGHFMDWVLNSLDSSSSERLFLWLLITCIPDFWANLISSRRRGKRLAQLLLAHAEKIYSLGSEARKASVLGLLESIITRVVISNPACLLLPDDWERCKDILQTCDQRRAHTKISRAIADLDDRNRQVMLHSNLGSSSSQQSLRLLYSLLDSLECQSAIFIDNLAFECMELIPDHNRLVSAVLKWSSSLYRQGLHRAYLVTRLLRRWNQAGLDICESIISYLPEMASDCSKEPEPIFRIIAELVRSKTFLIGRYLQWLIASGSLNPALDVQTAKNWQIRLLTEIPLTGLSPEVLNLRGTMLRGVSYSVDMEEDLISKTEETIMQQLADLTHTEATFDHQMIVDTEHFNRTICLEISRWLRWQVSSMIEPIDCSTTKANSAFTTCTISPVCFELIRFYLEKFDDLSILADVIGIVASSCDSHVLSASADTVCHHFQAFKFIGAFDSLFERIVSGYTAIRRIRIPEKDLLLSLSALSQLAHVDAQLMQMLNYDLGRYDQRNSIAVCSPVSDTMVDSTTRSDPEDAIERILSSGNNMDRQTMDRVFLKIVSYVEDRICQGDRPLENFSAWICRLQNFEERTFHAVLNSWMYTVLASQEQRTLSVVLPALVVSGCYTLSHFLEAIQACMRRLRLDHPVDSFRVAVIGLDRILPNDELGNLQHHYAYQFRTQQILFSHKQNSGLLDLIKESFELKDTVPESQAARALFGRLLSHRLLSVLKHFAITNLPSVDFLLEMPRQASDGSHNTDITSVLDRIIDPLNALNLPGMSHEEQATTILRTADQLSLPFCQLKLRDLFNSIPPGAPSIESLPATFIDYLKLAPELDHAYLLDIAAGMDTKFTQLIREHAEEEILSLSTFLCDLVIDGQNDNLLDAPSCIPRLLEVICATNTGSTENAQVVLLAPLVERLRGLTEALHQLNRGPVESDEANINGNTALIARLCSWLNVLLRLVVYQIPALMLKAGHQHQTALMWSLRNLFTHPYLEAFPSTTRYIFDVAVLLSDYMSEDVRKSFARPTCTKCCSDSRCTFIFGADSQHDGWLGLTKSVSQVMTSQTSATQSSVQTVNSAQTQPQHFGAGPAASQRALNQPQQQQQQQGRTFAYQQQQQTHKLLSQQLQRLGSNGQNSQSSQMQQMQQMQAMAQRHASAFGGQSHRTPASQAAPTTVKNSNARLERIEAKPIPYSLNRWEMLPESGGNASGNETAISLNLFGARKA